MEFCRVCKSEKIELFLSKNNLHYWLCNFCETIFLDPRNFINSNNEKKHYIKHNNSINDYNYIKFLSKLVEPLKKKFLSTKLV